MTAKTILKTVSTKTISHKKSVISDHISFIKVSSNSAHFSTVQRFFKKMLAPIYGDQNKAIAQIKAGLDRVCEVMLKYDNPVGLVVYKKKLQNEYGLKNALELKSLFLFNPVKNSRQGYGSRLFKKIDEIARDMGTNLIYCTASSKVSNSIQCAVKNGYEIERILEKNKERTLYLLVKRL